MSSWPKMENTQALDGDPLLSTKLHNATLDTLSSSRSSDHASPAASSVDTPPTPPHRSHSPSTNAKRTDPFQFGQRYLETDDDVFEYNAWDHVNPDPVHTAYCEEQYQKQKSNPVSDFDKSRFNTRPQKWWDLFYKQKTRTFFKDRKWLRQEFPILDEVTRADAGRKVVLEVGAGAGNTAFPILRGNQNPELMVHAYDFSKWAVETMRSCEEYDERFMRAEVWDVTTKEDCGLPPGLGEDSVDVVIMIFVFSALSPDQWEQAVTNIYRVLKPGGEVLFRDYGKGDLAQVRFKAGRWMDENFYVRGDGTRVYFFEKEELMRVWGGEIHSTGSIDIGKNGSQEDLSEERDTLSPPNMRYHPAKPSFDILNLDVDRRLIVNRHRRIKMYRCWIQGRFRKR